MNKKMKNALGLLVLILILCSVACNDSNGEMVQVKEYTITFDSNGGSAVDEIKVKSNEPIVLPNNPTKDDEYFVGWFRDEKYENAFKQSYLSGDVTLYAKWCNHKLEKDSSKKGVHIIESIAATCIEVGSTEGLICDDCGVLIETVVVSALGHIPGTDCRCTVCNGVAHDYENGTCKNCKANIYTREGDYFFLETTPKAL